MISDTPAQTLLIANGRHLEEVKEYLGHSSIRVTSDRYAYLFPKARAEMADAMEATFRAAAEARVSPACHDDVIDLRRAAGEAPVRGL